MNFSTQTLLGWWSATGGSLALDSLSVADAVRDLHSPLLIVNTSQGPALARGGIASLGSTSHDPESFPIMGVVPPARLEQLGDQSFRQDFQLRYNYVSGSMAAGIGSERIVEEMARVGMLGFFGSAGLSPSRVEAAIDRLHKLTNPSSPAVGFNLIHSPNERLSICICGERYDWLRPPPILI